MPAVILLLGDRLGLWPATIQIDLQPSLPAAMQAEVLEVPAPVLWVWGLGLNWIVFRDSLTARIFARELRGTMIELHLPH